MSMLAQTQQKLAQDELLKLGSNQQVKNQVGSASAEMLDSKGQRINNHLRVFAKQLHRFEILAEVIG